MINFESNFSKPFFCFLTTVVSIPILFISEYAQASSRNVKVCNHYQKESVEMHVVISRNKSLFHRVKEGQCINITYFLGTLISFRFQIGSPIGSQLILNSQYINFIEIGLNNKMITRCNAGQCEAAPLAIPCSTFTKWVGMKCHFSKTEKDPSI